MVRVLIIDTHLREISAFDCLGKTPFKGVIKCQILLLSFKGNIADLLVVSFLAPLEDYLGLKIATSEDGTVNLRPLVQEVPSLIPETLHPCFNVSPFCLALYSGFQKLKFPRLPNPDFYTWGNSEYSAMGAVPTHTAFVQVALDFVSVYTAVFCPKKNTVLYKQ